MKKKSLRPRERKGKKIAVPDKILLGMSMGLGGEGLKMK